MEVVRFKMAMLQDQSLRVRRVERRQCYGRYHYHKEIQVTMVESGRGTILIGNSIHHFSGGDILIIGENVPHMIQKSNDYDGNIKTTSLYFYNDLFGISSIFETELPEIREFLRQAQKGILIRQSHSLDILKLGYEINTAVDTFERIILLFRILNKIRHNEGKVWLNDFIPRLLINEDIGQRLDAVYSYTLEHLKENIGLDQVASVANLSVSRFCRVFKNHSDKTYIEFLHLLRIEEACAQLIRTTKNISEVAYDSGFKNLSNFNKTFKEVKGCSPSEFRKRLKKFKEI